jgi:hypothetical protein
MKKVFRSARPCEAENRYPPTRDAVNSRMLVLERAHGA